MVLAVLWAASTVHVAAAEERLDVAAIAKDILGAPTTDQDAKLVEAAKADWSPWLLAAHLRAGGATKTLLAKYERLVRSRAPGLGAYLARTKPAAATAKHLAAVEAAAGKLRADEVEACLATLAAARIPSEPVTVASAAAAHVEARAQLRGQTFDRCVIAALRAGDSAMEIGWQSLAEPSYLTGLRIGPAALMLRQARECAFGLLGIQEARGDTHGAAQSHHDLAGIDYRADDYSGSLRHLEEAHALYSALGRASEAADVRSLRAVVYARIGDLARAREDLRALEADESVFQDAASLAEYLSNAAIVYTRLGDTARSMKLLERSLTTARKAKDPFAEGVALGNLGLVHRHDGQWEDAIAAYRSAIALFERSGYALNVAFGQFAVADGVMQRAREALRAAAARQPAEQTRVRAEARKTCAAAKAMLDEALAVFNSVGAAGAIAAVQETRAQIDLALGDLDELEDRFEAACAEARRLSLWRTLVAGSTGLVRTQVESEKLVPAIRTAQRAIEDLARGHGALTDTNLARARSFEADVFDLGVRAAVGAERIDDLHYFLETGRAAALLRGLGGRAAALRATVPLAVQEELRTKTRAKAEAMAAFNKALENRKLDVRRAGREAYEKARDVERATRENIESIEAESAKRLIPPRIEALADLRRRLPEAAPKGVPVVYLAFNLQARDAWVLIATKEDQRVVHLGVKHVAPIHDALRQIVEDRHGEFKPQVLTTLREHLIAPLGLPKGKAVYLISPDRELAYVPYSALLPDEVGYALVPSATTYLLLAQQRRKRGKGTVGIGDPTYGHMPDKEVFKRRGGYTLGRLPLSKGEIEAITKGANDVRLLDEKATEDGLVKALQSKGPTWRWRAVHFACHGLVDVELPTYSALALTPSPGEDGFLTYGELLRVPLRTDVAILSACQTGRGSYVQGEGMLGLARAFMYAGAPRVIASLWKVDDKATSALMVAFHREWKAGRPVAQALRKAQAEVRDTVVETKDAKGKVTRTKPWEDPTYWAAWVLWGLPD